jgi:hypothetical protein
MPKVSSAPEDAYRFKGSFEEGWGVVTSACAIVYQFPPQKEASEGRQAGHQDPPGLFAQLSIQRYSDGEGNKAAAAEEEVLLSIASADKMDGQLNAVHPGKYEDGNPESDATDMGGALGATGDTLFALADGYQINDNVKWMRFCASLVEKGFKPAILKRTYFPDMAGLYAFFKNVTKKMGNYDSKLFVVDKIVRFPYEKSAGAPAAAKGKGAAAKPAAAVAASAAPAASAATTASNGSFDVDEIIMAVLTETLGPNIKSKSVEFHTLKDLKKVRLESLMALNKHKPAVDAANKKAVMDAMTETKLQEIGEATGVFTVDADGSVKFA